jgi:DNA-binding GntR family transcriptional regulator
VPVAGYTALASDERWAEHETLMQAIARRDGNLAGDILFEHDRRTGETTPEIHNSAKSSHPGLKIVFVACLV